MSGGCFFFFSSNRRRSVHRGLEIRCVLSPSRDSLNFIEGDFKNLPALYKAPSYLRLPQTQLKPEPHVHPFIHSFIRSCDLPTPAFLSSKNETTCLAKKDTRNQYKPNPHIFFYTDAHLYKIFYLLSCSPNIETRSSYQLHKSSQQKVNFSYL